MYSIEKIETIEKRVEFILIIVVAILFGLVRNCYFKSIGIKVGQVDTLLIMNTNLIVSFLLCRHFINDKS